ncbi:MAG: hypothetical protein U5R06_04575 [candidate division KSB1 bacterium]|nr:hypothetical protein [candidate division KSB1 bacterium]
MNYATRNTIIIAVIVLTVLIAGYYYTFIHIDKQLARQVVINAEKQERLNELRRLESDKSDMLQYLEHLKELSLGKIGTLVSGETPGETFDYILREIQKAPMDVEINLIFKQDVPFVTIQAREYEISGMADFENVYKLIWFLENGPVFYDIPNIQFERVLFEEEGAVVSQARELTEFSLTVRAFIREEGPDIEDITRTEGEPYQIADLVSNSVSRLVLEEEERVARTKSTGSGSGDGEGDATADGSAPAAESQGPQLPSFADKVQLLALTSNAVLVSRNGGAAVKVRKGEDFFGAMLQDIRIMQGEAVFVANSGQGKRIVLTTKRN